MVKMIILMIMMMISNIVRDDCSSESKHLEGQLGRPIMEIFQKEIGM